MTRQIDLTGKIVSEEEVAADLGFSSVHEMRRWDTEQGQRVAELEHKLRSAIDERDRFPRVGRRMMAVLERIKPTLTDAKFILAIGVVCGGAVDWEHELDGWWPEERRETI